MALENLYDGLHCLKQLLSKTIFKKKMGGGGSKQQLKERLHAPCSPYIYHAIAFILKQGEILSLCNFKYCNIRCATTVKQLCQILKCHHRAQLPFLSF